MKPELIPQKYCHFHSSLRCRRQLKLRSQLTLVLIVYFWTLLPSFLNFLSHKLTFFCSLFAVFSQPVFTACCKTILTAIASLLPQQLFLLPLLSCSKRLLPLHPFLSLFTSQPCFIPLLSVSKTTHFLPPPPVFPSLPLKSSLLLSASLLSPCLI